MQNHFGTTPSTFPSLPRALGTQSALLVLLCSACASSGQVPAPRHPRPAASGLTERASAEPCDPARDRAAILGMAGSFEVSFAFDETESLSDGYALQAPYRTEATEIVSVLEAAERRVVLQHVLLIEKHSGERKPMKHWRQDWTFEDRELLEFSGRRTWQRRELTPAEAHCTWSQAVYEVDDGPRYESYGRFVHEGSADAAQSTWTSGKTWRPLPRREYTQRNDYDVLLGTNRHVITRDGWRHEQDNQKLVLSTGRPLARERGSNAYRRVDSADATLATRYLEQTGRFWSEVRAEWADELAREPRVLVHQELAGKPLYETLFPLAEAAGAQPQEAQRARISELLASYIEPAPNVR